MLHLLWATLELNIEKETGFMEEFYRVLLERIFFLSIFEITHRIEYGAGKNKAGRYVFLLHLLIFSVLGNFLVF